MQKIGIEVGLDVGDLVSGAVQGERALSQLTESMKKAKSEGRWDDYKDLAIARDRLQPTISRFGQDIKSLSNNPNYQAVSSNGATVIKMDGEYASLIKAEIDTLKKLIVSIDGSIQSGDMAGMNGAVGQIVNSGNEFHNTVEKATTPSKTREAQDVLAKIFSVDKMVGAITGGVEMYVAQLDRSGIISKLGSGDAVGAQVEELHRKGAMESSMGAMILPMILGIIGAIVGSLFPGGTFVGFGIGSALGGLGKLLGMDEEAAANIKATQDAKAKQWESQAPGAMELNALLGGYGGSISKNTSNLRVAFDEAANKFGYSMEDGVETVKQAAEQGLGRKEVVAAAENIFNYERGTGADRGILTQVETRMRRFGKQEDALGWAFRGNQASGLGPGQYTEFLRSMQRIFEDGISKGFVRGGKRDFQ